MIASAPLSQTAIKALVTEMRQYGMRLSLAHAWQLLRLVGDHKLIVDALLMEKRPTWLEEMIGPREAIAKEKKTK